MLVTGFAVLLHLFWRTFHAKCWRATAPAVRPAEVSDLLFSLWSWLKVQVSKLVHTPPHLPSALGEESLHLVCVKALFSKYEAGTRLSTGILPTTLTGIDNMCALRAAIDNSTRWLQTAPSVFCV